MVRSRVRLEFEKTKLVAENRWAAAYANISSEEFFRGAGIAAARGRGSKSLRFGEEIRSPKRLWPEVKGGPRSGWQRNVSRVPATEPLQPCAEGVRAKLLLQVHRQIDKRWRTGRCFARKA